MKDKKYFFKEKSTQTVPKRTITPYLEELFKRSKEAIERLKSGKF